MKEYDITILQQLAGYFIPEIEVISGALIRDGASQAYRIVADEGQYVLKSDANG